MSVRKKGALRIVRTDDVIARFMRKIRVDGECWLWTGTSSGNGYGYAHVERHDIMAHRLSFLLFVADEIPNGMCICHRCDRPLCVNPSHLFVGTHADNMRDMVSKGRNADNRGRKYPPRNHPVGQQVGSAKLTDAEVIDMRARFASGATCAELAMSSPVHIATVRRICGRKIWRHL